MTGYSYWRMTIRRLYDKAQTPLVRFVLDLFYKLTNPTTSAATQPTDALPSLSCWSQVWRRRWRQTCDQHSLVDALVLYLYNQSTAQTTCIDILTLPVTCNNNTPMLQHGGFYGQICWICMLNYSRPISMLYETKTQNAGLRVNLCCFFVLFEVGVVPVVNPIRLNSPVWAPLLNKRLIT